MTRRLLVVVLFVAVCGCNPNHVTPAPTQTSLAIVGNVVLAAPGQLSQLSAFAIFSDASRRAITSGVTWAVDNQSVATITSGGLLKATGVGTATVSATTQSFSGTATVQVLLGTTGFTIGGTVLLSAVGQTSQLTGIATLSDGSTQDVTSKAIWSSATPTVATVSSAGLVTVVGIGTSIITATYTPPTPATALTRSTTIVVTPSGTFVVNGRTRDPGQGNGMGNLVGVSIVAQSGPSTTSVVSPEGTNNFSLAGMTDSVITFTKNGYEPVVIDTSTVPFASGLAAKNLDVPMQPVAQFSVGTSVSRTIAPVDVKYPQNDGSLCSPCQLIRLTAPSDGTLHLVLSWSDTRSVPNMWVNGVRFPGTGGGPTTVTADVAVSAGEVLVYVGQQNGSAFNFMAFTLATSMK